MRRSCWRSVAGIVVLAGGAAAPAAELYVDAASAAANPTGTQQSPYRTVQAAINAAVGGDEIRVAGGMYVENLRIESKAVVLRGGYTSAWVRDIAGTRTTLSGAGGNAVINIIEADATIDGFRITGGTGSTDQLPYAYLGGGIYSRGGSVTLTNNIIEKNDIRSVNPPPDYNLGGGVYITDAPSATITDNVVRGNFAGRGAGIAVFGEKALIQGNTIENNVAVGDHGGGAFIAVASVRITQNIFRGNEVGRDLQYGWGGGVIVVNPITTAELSFNVLYENFAAGYGAAEFVDEGARASIHHELIYANVSKIGCESVSAISVDGGENVGSQVTISHCTIVGNICENSIRGNGLQVEGKSTAEVTNCIFWDNGGDDFAVANDSRMTVTYTCSEEPIAGIGNISTDPKFVNAAARDYHLAAGSPCVDAGDPASPFANEPGNNGGRADMGRYGNASDTTTQVTNPGLPSGNGSSSPSNPSSNGTGTTNDSTSTRSNTGFCGTFNPFASAMMLSMSLMGVRRARRQSMASRRRMRAGA